MEAVLIFSIVVTLAHVNTGSMSDNCPTTTSLQQSIDNLTNLVKNTLTKSAQSCLANADSSSNVAILVQLTMMQQLFNHNQMNTRGCCPTKSSYNDSKVIVELGEKLSTKIETTSIQLETKVNTKIDGISTYLVNLKNMFDTKIDKLTAKVNRLMTLTNITEPIDYPPSSLLHSCEEININWPDSPSDYYIIVDTNGHPRHVYCHMESLCNSQGGWMRVAYLNMSDPTEECPPGFRLYNQNGIRACGRPATSPVNSCQSVKFPSYSISYSQVCGQIIGYQYGSPDAIYPGRSQKNNLNGAYVDGVSITYGNPRQHIWTFMAALQENYFHQGGQCACPCAPNSPVTVPSFIGNDYFCESGCPGHWQWNTFYPGDPLWDGKQCGLIEKACCLAPGLPWFYKTLNFPTTDYIEMRVCADEVGSWEDSPVNYFEIYVK